MSTSSSTSSSSSSESDVVDEVFFQTVVDATHAFIQPQAPPWTRKPALSRNRLRSHTMLVNDYFSKIDPTYPEDIFRRRFRMNRPLFSRILEDVERVNPWFQQRYDARGRIGFSALQKCTAAIRQMAYGTAPDAFDEHLKMSERTIRLCIYKFSETIITLYGKRYLRRPTPSDIQTFYAAHEARHGFRGMLGSIDCTHWEWQNYPNAWQGQYMRGDHPHPTIMLEAVASADLWIWHSFFGIAGSNNDINVLDISPIFDDIVNGSTLDSSFHFRETTYKLGYYLADGIYL